MNIRINTIFLISVLVLGLASYSSPLPILDQDITAFDFKQQLGSLAFAQEEEGAEEEEEEEEENGEEEEEELEAELVDTTGKDHGKAKFEKRIGDRTRLSIEIEDVPGPCDAFTATIEGTAVTGTFEFDVDTPDGVQCDLNLDSRDGDTVPSVDAEDEVIVSNNGFTLSGTFSLEEEEEAEEEEEEIEIEVEVENGVAKVEVEFDNQKHRFLVTDDTSQDAIAAEILALPEFPLDTIDAIKEIWDFEVEEEEEIEIEVEVENGVAKVEVEFDDQKHRFLVTDDTSQDAIAAEILALPEFPLDTIDAIKEIWDFEVEEEEVEIESMSSTALEVEEWEASQTAQDMIHELEQRIEELEARIQTLLEKLESGEYFGTVPEVDPVIKSYIISFDGSATSIDDESIVTRVEGEIFIETIVTRVDTSKFRVTGGEILIEKTFYDLAFGKARVSSSGPSGEKDSLVLIGQVIDFADINDDSSTLKLVINSEMSLEGDFGLDPISIEILSQSKIAGQWYLSGSGQLSLLGG